MNTHAQNAGRDIGDITPLSWLIWWVEDCLLQADVSWWDGKGAQPEPPLHRDEVHVNAVRFNRHFSLPLMLPPEPSASLMQIGALDSVQRETVLRLITRVCQPGRRPNHADAESIWCERLAKALRPGLWLPSSMTFSASSLPVCYLDALMLLRIRYGETCWPRLRLLFPRTWGNDDHTPTMSLPAARLNALCDALIWKASALTSISNNELK